MLAGNGGSLLSKHDAPQSSVVEDFLRVPLISDFVYRLNSSTAHASLHGYDANLKKKKINRVAFQFLLQKRKVLVL